MMLHGVKCCLMPDTDQSSAVIVISDDKSSQPEDDSDVITPNVTRSKSLPTSPFLSARNCLRGNTVIRTFIENHKQFDSSWTEAAGAVFSDSHPFQLKRKDQEFEEKEENTRPKSAIIPRIIVDEKDRKDLLEKKVVEASKECSKNASPKKGDKAAAQEAGAETKKKETEQARSPQSSGERKSGKKKKSTMSLVRQKTSAYINSEKLMHLKSKVETAVREHKVYSMTGHYSSVRRALKERGWVEKIDSEHKDGPSWMVNNRNEGFPKDSEHCEAEIINRMLRNITEDLCWLSKPYPYCWKDINKCDMINRLPKAYFSNKVGLANSLSNMHWYYEPGICTTQYPRTYNISVRDEYDAFQEDFRLTACVSTLKWLTATYKQGGESAVWSIDGRVDTNIIEFSMKRCSEYVRFREHEDIDMMEMTKTWDHQWDHFLTQYYKLVNEGNILREIKGDPPIIDIVANADVALNQLRPYWPQMDIEGINDWWIVKPGGRCCGNGIVIRNNLEQIMAIVNPTVTRETRYVVQKYIERPLLIYNTKFDIRQWFLVTNVYPLTIWMYKESYLRFCSSTFNLKTMHESVHLCNNAVQRRYKNGKRDRNLPDENMWDSYTFQTHLRTIGHPNVWEELIYPGMRESFVGALLTSQDNMERRRNCFELYGVDFMISDQITDGPWLIEINSNPAMDASSSVTARMCPQVLEDIIKVVIDRRNDRNAPTGAFELAYRQNCPPIPPYLGMSLGIRGKKVYKSSNENRNPRRPNFQRESSESESASSEDENIVQKRCYTDFMQPIKTLREEIHRLGRQREAKGENLSDSWANDSDTSRGSTDRRMALEGKEIELKKKKVRKRRLKKAQNAYLQKNKSNDVKGSKAEGRKFVIQDSKIEGVRMGRIINESFARHREAFHRTIGQRPQVAEKIKPEEHSGDQQYQASGECEKVRPLIITGLWEPEFSEFVATDRAPDSNRNSTNSRGILNGNSKVYLRVDGGNCSSRDNSNSSRGSASSLNDSEKNSSDAADPRDFSRLSRRNGLRYSDLDLSTALSITSTELLVKGRQRPNKWQSSKSSFDYLREWKHKIDETRRNCEDVLNKLRSFKENNSKKKFQDLIRQKVEEENRTLTEIRKSRVIEEKNKLKVRKELDKECISELKPKRVWSSNHEFHQQGTGEKLDRSNEVLPKIQARSKTTATPGEQIRARRKDE